MNARAAWQRRPSGVCSHRKPMVPAPESARVSHQATCRSCARSSPVVRGAREEADARFVELGWKVVGEGEYVCAICCARAKTLAPPR